MISLLQLTKQELYNFNTIKFILLRVSHFRLYFNNFYNMLLALLLFCLLLNTDVLEERDNYYCLIRYYFQQVKRPIPQFFIQ